MMRTCFGFAITTLFTCGAITAATDAALPVARAGAANNYRLIIFVALMTFMLTAQIFMGTRQAPTQADSVHSPVSNMASPPSSTP
jgi:hypothetical protein